MKVNCTIFHVCQDITTKTAGAVAIRRFYTLFSAACDHFGVDESTNQRNDVLFDQFSVG